MKTREEIKEKIECKFDEMIYYVINLQNLTNELTNQKKIMILKNKELQKLIDKATNYYLKTLAKNGSMPDEAVEMFNLLEGNK